MYKRDYFQDPLEMLESALAEVGYFVTESERVQMASVLGRINQVTTRSDAEALCAELEWGRNITDEGVPASCDPAVWLAEAECA